MLPRGVGDLSSRLHAAVVLPASIGLCLSPAQVVVLFLARRLFRTGSPIPQGWDRLAGGSGRRDHLNSVSGAGSGETLILPPGYRLPAQVFTSI